MLTVHWYQAQDDDEDWDNEPYEDEGWNNEIPIGYGQGWGDPLPIYDPRAPGGHLFNDIPAENDRGDDAGCAAADEREREAWHVEIRALQAARIAAFAPFRRAHARCPVLEPWRRWEYHRSAEFCMVCAEHMPYFTHHCRGGCGLRLCRGCTARPEAELRDRGPPPDDAAAADAWMWEPVRSHGVGGRGGDGGGHDDRAYDDRAYDDRAYNNRRPYECQGPHP